MFGGFTTRGEGITNATFRYPEVVSAIHVLAATRPTGFTAEPYLCVQLNAASSLPLHKDKNNFSRSWLLGLGDYEGGRLWVESPVGTDPPPCAVNSWQKALRCEFIDVRNKWTQFDPQLYHCVEPVTRGERRSIALFSPRSWKRIPPHCLDELIEAGFYPPFSAQDAESEETALPLEGSFTPLPSLAALGQAHQPSQALWPLSGQVYNLTLPDPDEQTALDEWCRSDHVALPSTDLPASDGSMLALNEEELKELSDHVLSGHVTKSNLCKSCLEAEGPRRIHRSIRDVDKATHVLHIDIAGPLTLSDDGYTYFLVGSLRLPGLPLLIDVKLLTTRTSAEVCDELEKMVAFFEALQTEGLTIGETCRIKRLHSDKAGEFTAPFFAKFLSNHKTIDHTFTSGYDPQANGTAERSVGLLKALAARSLASAGLGHEYWSYAVKYASQSLLCHALQKTQRSLPFGATVAAQVLGHRDVKFPESRSITGRLLYWDHLRDQISYILCPPDSPEGDPVVYRAGLPVRLPPGINIDDIAPPEALPPIIKNKFDRPLTDNGRPLNTPPGIEPIDLDAREDESAPPGTEPIDLDEDDPLIADAALYSSVSEPDALPPDCPFTFLYLSSQDSIKDDNLEDLEQLNSLPDGSRKQETTHIPVTAEQVLQSDGEERFKWMCAGRKELDNLTGTGTVECISPEVRDRLKAEARASGKKYAELPSKGVFTIKPDKYKVRIVACGNKTHETFGKISTTDLDTAMMRYLVSWGASSPDFTLASLGVTAAFLNAPLPEGRVVILKPPNILYKLQLLPPGYVWLVHKAIYGLREAPNLWSEERTDMMTKLTFSSEGESYSVILSQIHKSLCLLVKTKSLLKSPSTDRFGLTNLVLPEHVEALSGIYVDDYLTSGPPKLVEAFMTTLRKLWKTSEPQYLALDHELTFLGVTLRKTPEGILLHQQLYTDDLLQEHAPQYHSQEENYHR